MSFVFFGGRHVNPEHIVDIGRDPKRSNEITMQTCLALLSETGATPELATKRLAELTRGPSPEPVTKEHKK